jgi:hypothetical protein
MVLWTFRQEAAHNERGPKVLITKPAQGGPSASSPLKLDGFLDGQVGGWIVLTLAKKGRELKNNSTKPRDLTENGQLTLSQDKIKKGEHAADDDDDDGCGENQCFTRLSDSNTVLWGIAPQDSVYIALSTYQTGKNLGGRGGYGWSTRHI